MSKDKSWIPNILFALRSKKGKDGKSEFVKQNGRNPNILKSRMIEKCILEQDPKIEIEPGDFSYEVDSTFLVGERVPGTELKGAFKKVLGQPKSKIVKKFVILKNKTTKKKGTEEKKPKTQLPCKRKKSKATKQKRKQIKRKPKVNNRCTNFQNFL